MNLVTLSLSYLRRRALSTALNVLLLALGIATIVVLLLLSHQLERTLSENAQGIDAVVGAKGSPLQLILSSVYHIDAPTGNIPVATADAIKNSPMVAEAIPLALGDSYAGYRIVGAPAEYAALYEAAPEAGTLYEAPMEVTLGAAVAAETGRGVGDELVSTHGLGEGGEAHGGEPLRVVGVFSPTGTVLDRLVLTSVETVWAVHEHTEEDEPEAEEEPEALAEGETAAEEEPAAPPRPPMPTLGMMMQGGSPPGAGAPGGSPGGGREYTALLVRYASPLAAAMFPRFVNAQTDLQAASPAFETARLLNLLGVGLDALRAFGFILIFAAALGVFIALYNALKERKYDLAVLRSMGTSRGTLLAHVLLEGLLLATLGTLLGLLLGHVAAAVLSGAVEQAQGLALTAWTFVPAEVWLVGLALGVGVVAALIPAFQAYRTDIAETLAVG